MKQVLIEQPKITQQYVDDLYDEYRMLYQLRRIQIELDVPFYKLEETEQKLHNVMSAISDVELMTIDPDQPLIDDNGNPIILIKNYKDLV